MPNSIGATASSSLIDDPSRSGREQKPAKIMFDEKKPTKRCSESAFQISGVSGAPHSAAKTKQALVASPQMKTNSAKPPKDDSSALGQLAVKFSELIQKDPNKSIDLSEATTMLNVPRRRLYDVVNILEGTGLLRRTNVRSVFMWAADDNIEDNEKEENAKKRQRDVEPMHHEQKKLDQWIRLLERRKKSPSPHKYMTAQQVAAALCKPDDTLLILSTHHGSKLQVHDKKKQKIADNINRGDYSFSVAPAPEASPAEKIIPRAYLLESPKADLKKVDIAPAPRLLETCCLDLTLNAVNVGDSSSFKDLDVLEAARALQRQANGHYPELSISSP